ncbi:hypothetical protein OG357_27150 [Streptomyces sp. NBC_01255]|uniref:hypothetical protein n=1 Tax=Streptomyces sp. NBC_01255 TaxID=2903798 RepID=UPI002E2EFF8A|nr:hypothetical protein [Streptomyces sp. NBC_01255]
MHTSDEYMGSEYMGSELVDLSDVPLSALRSQSPSLHARSLERLLRQVESPRVNFAGDGKPGRAD